MIITLALAITFFFAAVEGNKNDRETLNRVVAAQEKVLKDTGSYTDSIQALREVDPKINNGNLRLGLIEDEQEQS